MTLSDWEISSIVHGVFHNPHSILGMHYLGDGKGIVCRVWDPHALKIIINSQESKKEYSLRRLNEDGLFEIVLPDIKSQSIGQIDKLKQRLQIMIAIVSSAGDMQEQV